MPANFSILTKQTPGSKETWEPITTFAEGKDLGKIVLGGKGAGLAEMTSLGLPVPPGFTVSTDASVAYNLKAKGTMFLLRGKLRKAHKALVKATVPGLLVSVRSGARVSMPGMMDTVLNVGMTEKTLPKWIKRIGEWAALDCYRRLYQMYGNVVLGIPSDEFEGVLEAERDFAEVATDSELSVKNLNSVLVGFKSLYIQHGVELPDTPEGQLIPAVEAVLKSWMNPRAVEYRKMENIPDDWGTAVTVQAMVFGNSGEGSGSGVLFTRNPATGDNTILGEFLPNAQGEDVVAGIRTPLPLSKMQEEGFGGALAHLTLLVADLEKHYGDMQDVEFTIDRGKLWILQTRRGQRTAGAAFRIACDMVDEGSLTQAQALARITPSMISKAKTPTVAPSFKGKPNAVGTPGCPGIVTGKIVTTAQEAVDATEPCVLVRKETDPNDIAGMNAAVGILTETGGTTSHAAVVARSFNTACVVGAEGCMAAIAGHGYVTIDGATGRVWLDQNVTIVGGEENEHVARMVDWAYEQTGALREGTILRSRKQRVMTAGWAGSDDVGLGLLADWKDASGVLFDLRGESYFKREEDAGLYSLFGADTNDDAEQGWIVERLVSVTGNGASVFAPGLSKNWEKMLRKTGYKIARQVETVADMLDADGAVAVSDEVIEKVIGGFAAFKELQTLLANSGKPVEMLAPSKNEAAVIAEAFGKES